jgi:hypothetical protein
MTYELMDLTTGNLIEVYVTENAALKDVAGAIHRGGEHAVETLALGVVEPDGPGYIAAEGLELARRAVEAGAASEWSHAVA